MFATWKFDREDDGRVIAEAHVICYGDDALDAAAQCVKHLLVDVADGIADDQPDNRNTAFDVNGVPITTTLPGSESVGASEDK